MSEDDTYTNYPHGDLPDANPGHDQDFSGPHLDPEDLDRFGKRYVDYGAYVEAQENLTPSPNTDDTSAKISPESNTPGSTKI